jgi:predicted porin
MKKTLLAVAAMGAFASAAQAQSSVSVYGVMDGSYTATTNKIQATAGAVTTTTNQRNTVNGDGALATSRLGFRGTEDLGGGKTAQFQLEYDLRNIGNGGNGTENYGAQSGASTNAASEGFGARYSWIGISDKGMGGLRIGRQEASIHSAYGVGATGYQNNMPGTIYSAGTSNSTASTVAIGSNSNISTIRPYDVFVNQAITYISPTISGVSGQVQYADNAISTNTAATTGAKQFGANISYAGIKNLTVAYGFQQSGVVADTAITVGTQNGLTPSNLTTAVSLANTKTVSNVVAANYNFGILQAFVVGTQLKITTLNNQTVTRDQTAYEIGARAPITPTISVFASGFMGSKTMDANAATLSGTTSGRADLSGYQLGAMYNFSKRTTVYAIYGTQDVKGKEAATGTKISTDAYAVGMRHTF